MAYYNPAHGEQQQVQYQAPIIYYAAPTITYQPAVIKHYEPYYKKETSTGLGATQIVLACISIAAGSMAIVYEAGCYYIGVGIWAGVFYLIAGSLAVAAAKDPTDSLIAATLSFSVFDILIGIVQLTIASIGVSEDISCHSHYAYYCGDWWEEAAAANSMMIAVGSLEIIFGIWLMVVCARAIDKGSKAQQTTVPVTYAPHQPQPVFIQAHPTFQQQPPSFQPQPPFPQSQPPSFQSQPPPYYVQQQDPSTSNQQQMMYVGVHQAPLTTIKL